MAQVSRVAEEPSDVEAKYIGNFTVEFTEITIHGIIRSRANGRFEEVDPRNSGLSEAGDSVFNDITTLLKDKKGFHLMIDRLCGHYEGHTIGPGGGHRGARIYFCTGAGLPVECGLCAGAEGRTNCLRRRPKISYKLEYGTDSMEVHEDAVQKGQRVLLCDDLLATGGTAAAAVQLIRSLGGVVERRSVRRGAEFPEGPCEVAGD